MANFNNEVSTSGFDAQSYASETARTRNQTRESSNAGWITANSSYDVVGLNTTKITLITPTIRYAILSALARPIFFGTSSPNTKVKYDSTQVINTTKIVVSVSSDIKSITIILANSCAKLSAAKALAKKPDKVIAI